MLAESAGNVNKTSTSERAGRALGLALVDCADDATSAASYCTSTHTSCANTTYFLNDAQQIIHINIHIQTYIVTHIYVKAHSHTTLTETGLVLNRS